jgi:hypothetical protein
MPINIPVLLTIFIVFLLWLQYEMRKKSKQSKKIGEAFWQNENSSNLARRKDITDLDYITVSLDQLPMEDHEDQTINSYRDTILSLSDKKILNLTGFTNTELKYEYGAVNLNQLSEYDNNYTVLVSILHKWAERLYSHGFIEDAMFVLQFAVACYTDVTKSYKLLAEIYKTKNVPEKINDLIDIIPKTKMLDKEKLINELTVLKIF